MNAMDAEYDTLETMGTWIRVHVSQLPPGTKVYRGKWVFDVKTDAKGEIEKFVSRACPGN